MMRRIFVCPAADRTAINDAFDGIGFGRPFQAELQNVGDEYDDPVLEYICDWLFIDGHWKTIKDYMGATVTIYDEGTLGARSPRDVGLNNVLVARSKQIRKASF